MQKAEAINIAPAFLLGCGFGLLKKGYS